MKVYHLQTLKPIIAALLYVMHLQNYNTTQYAILETLICEHTMNVLEQLFHCRRISPGASQMQCGALSEVFLGNQ